MKKNENFKAILTDLTFSQEIGSIFFVGIDDFFKIYPKIYDFVVTKLGEDVDYKLVEEKL